MKPPLELHVKAQKNCRARDLLQHNSELSSDIINRCFDNGSVWLQKGSRPIRIRNAETQLGSGQEIYLYCNQSTLEPCPYQPVLIEDFETFSIWNKPSGMLSQGSKWGDHWALYRWIQQQVWPQRQSFITHRLDRYTRGLMIVAHTEECNALLHRMFENRQVQKTYRAIVKGLISEEQAFEISGDVQNKTALTSIQLISRNTQAMSSVIQAKPQTGRKHQIRIHLASIGHPVLNDRQYGTAPHQGDLQLQASALQFAHPYTQQKLQINLPQKELLSGD
jgi:tRNA pseudouridine32 synthase / 23S rRNA pseudouridine746 synthase